MSAKPDAPDGHTVRLWDLPTRLFHWVLAATVVGSLVTSQIGGNAMVWHTRLGLAALALLLFRVVWGFVGGRWSRFTSFLYGPGSVVAYLRGHSGPGGRYAIGHSPLGAWSVWAMLGLLGVQVATGLIADDEIATTGPLYRFVSSDTASQATGWHTTYGKWLLIGVLIAHVVAVLYYLWRKQDLIGPMLHGDARLPPGTPASADGASRRWVALLVMVAAAALAGWVGSLGSP